MTDTPHRAAASESAADTGGETASAIDAPPLLIDCDVHNAVHDWSEIRRRLPSGLRNRPRGGPGSAGYGNPFGVNRADAAPPGGGSPGSDPAFMAEHHLDAHGITHAVLTPANMLGFGVSADYRYAAAVASAYNDYLIEYWLEADPRFLGAAMIAPQWPAAAAEEIRRVGSHPRIVQTVSCSAARVPYGNAIYWPIYEAAAEMGLHVSIHPGAEGNGIAGPPPPPAIRRPTSSGTPTCRRTSWPTSPRWSSKASSTTSRPCVSSASKAASATCPTSCGGWTRTGSPCAN